MQSTTLPLGANGCIRGVRTPHLCGSEVGDKHVADVGLVAFPRCKHNGIATSINHSGQLDVGHRHPALRHSGRSSRRWAGAFKKTLVSFMPRAPAHSEPPGAACQKLVICGASLAHLDLDAKLAEAPDGAKVEGQGVAAGQERHALPIAGAPVQLARLCGEYPYPWLQPPALSGRKGSRVRCLCEVYGDVNELAFSTLD